MPDSVDALLEQLRSPDQKTRSAAQEGLWKLGMQVVPRLLPLLDDDRPEARYAAMMLLARFKAVEALPVLSDRLDRALLDDPQRATQIVSALGHFLPLEPAFEICQRLIRDADIKYKRQICAGLYMNGTQAQIAQGLIPVLTIPELRTDALLYLAKAGKDAEPATGVLLTLLGDSAASKERVVYALARVGDGRASEPLIRALADPSPQVRGFAAEGLGRLKDRHAIGQLRKLQRDRTVYSDADSDKGAPVLRVSDAANAALFKLGDPLSIVGMAVSMVLSPFRSRAK